MFGRKKRLLEQSQLYRQAGQVLETEAGKSLARAAYHGGKSMFIDGGISEVLNGFQGVRHLGQGVHRLKQSIDCHQAANALEEQAKNTKWWQLW